MPTLRDSSLDEVLASLDNWKTFEPNTVASVFISAIGFEDRASECFAQWCEARNGRGGIALLIEYPFNQEDNAVQERKSVTAACIQTLDWCCLSQSSLHHRSIQLALVNCGTPHLAKLVNGSTGSQVGMRSFSSGE